MKYNYSEKIKNAESLMKSKDKHIEILKVKIGTMKIEKKGNMKDKLEIVEKNEQTKLKNDILQQKIIEIE